MWFAASLGAFCLTVSHSQATPNWDGADGAQDSFDSKKSDQIPVSDINSDRYLSIFRLCFLFSYEMLVNI
jgi:hypothetical protein